MNKSVTIALVCFGVVIIVAIVVAVLILTLRSDLSETGDLEVSDFECGKRYMDTVVPLVTNGSDAPLGSAPWFAAILVFDNVNGKEDYYHSCGASIISPEWALTAAHCTVPDDCVNKCIVIAGSTKRMDAKFSYGTKHKIAQQIAFSKNNSDYYGTDIALIKVDPPFEYRKPGTEGRRAIGPVCLPNKQDEEITEKEGIVVGFGISNETYTRIIEIAVNNTIERIPIDYDSIVPENLRTARVPVVSRDECAKIPDDYVVPSYKKIPNYKEIVLSPQATICAGNRFEHRDTCDGDSGGPLTVDINDKATIIGITSFGLTAFCTIDPIWYGVYTRVSHYRNWIKEVTGV